MNFRITNQFFDKNLIIQFIQNITSVLFAICRDISNGIFDSLISCGIILKFGTKNIIDFKLCWTEFSDFFSKLNIELFAVILFLVYSQLVLVQFDKKFDYRTSCNFFLACFCLMNARP